MSEAMLTTTRHHANVPECKSSVTLDADVTLEDILIKADYADFLERTHLDRLRPEQHIELTVPGRYQDC